MKLALITGASSGIGKELAFLLASKKIPLIITSRRLSLLEELGKQLDVPLICHAADLLNPLHRQSLISLIKQHQPDLIINNAGYGEYGDLFSRSTQEELDILTVNATAPIEITLETAKMLIHEKKEGTILNLSSAAAFFAFPTFAAYAAAKASLSSFSQALDEEVTPYGVRVLTCCPGPVTTAFRKRAGKGTPQEKDKMAISPQKAAQLIFNQIEKKKRLQIIDWRMRLLISLTHFIPAPLMAKILKRSIADRWH